MPTLHTPDPDVLLLTQRPERHDAVAAALGRLGPGLRLDRTASPPLAARLALRGDVRLVLIDAAACADGGVGLAHHLARWRPDLAVLVLADDVVATTGPARQARWDRLDHEVRRWLARPPGGDDDTV